MITVDLSGLLEIQDVLEQNIDRAMQIAALNLVAQSTERVHGRGLDSRNEPITSTHKEGDSNRVVREPLYSDAYAAFRRSRGRQTGFIDLRLEGILQSAYTFRLVEKGFDTGYFTGDNAEKMRQAQNRHGSNIIHPSEEEVNGIIEDISTEIFR